MVTTMDDDQLFQKTCLTMPSPIEVDDFPSSNLLNPQEGGPSYLALKKSLRWNNGDTVTVVFIPTKAATESRRQQVKTYAGMWNHYSNVRFKFVPDGTHADIRLAINHPDERGNWALVGLNHRLQDNKLITMHLTLDGMSDKDCQRLTLHEFGHALGCVHEHQGPAQMFTWNFDKVFAFYHRALGWSKEMVRGNITAREDDTDHARYDPESIMLYYFDASWNAEGVAGQENYVLSRGDKEAIQKLYPKRGHGTGTFIFPPGADESAFPPAVHQASPPPQHNEKEMLFASAYSKPPEIAVGLRALDISTLTNVRCSAAATRITGDSFVIHVDTWSDSTLYGGCASWLETRQEDDDFRVGNFSTQDDPRWERPPPQEEEEAGNGSWVRPQKATKRVTFEKSFETTPNVVVWLTAFDMDRSQHIRVRAYAEKIDEDGFTINICTGGKSILYSASASWVAWNPNRHNTFSGSDTTRIHKDNWEDVEQKYRGEVDFTGGPFNKRPKVLLSVNELHFDNSYFVRFKAYESEVTKDGMTWNVDTWDDTRCFNVGVAYLAFGSEE